MIWFVLAAMTGLTVLCALWPLSRRRRADPGSASAVAFYKAQLAEIDRDVERGQLPKGEAAGARAEAGRRLIAADHDAAAAPAPSVAADWRRRRIAAVAILVIVPLAALGLYLRAGKPELADQPLAARVADVAQSGGLEAAVARVEAHLSAVPGDGKGYAVLAPAYARLGRYADAATAYREALRLLGDDPRMRADLGEALVTAAGGIVTAEARAAFDFALAVSPTLVKARFYVALAAEQDGDTAKAIDLYEKLVADSPPGAPWLLSMRARIAGLKGEPPPAAEAQGPAGAIAAMAPGAQKEAIRGMVERLAGRLAQNGDDAAGWLRLIRAYSVLQEPDKAKAALAGARKALAGNPDAGRDLDALAQELGLGG